MKLKLHPTKNSLRDSTRRGMIALLNQDLNDLLDLGLQAKHAHWNVKGPGFIALHELFDEVAKTLAEFSDDVAERAVALGGVASGNLQTLAQGSRLPPYPAAAPSGRAHAEALSESLARFGRSVRVSIITATEADDAGTADLLTGVSRGVDKLLWLVEAHGQAKD